MARIHAFRRVYFRDLMEILVDGQEGLLEYIFYQVLILQFEFEKAVDRIHIPGIDLLKNSSPQPFPYIVAVFAGSVQSFYDTRAVFCRGFRNPALPRGSHIML